MKTEKFLDGIMNIHRDDYIFWIYDKFRGEPIFDYPQLQPQLKFMKFMAENKKNVVYAYKYGSEPKTYFSSHFDDREKIIICVAHDVGVQKVDGKYISKNPKTGFQYKKNIMDSCDKIPATIKRIYAKALEITDEDVFRPLPGGICAENAHERIEHIKSIIRTPKENRNLFYMPAWDVTTNFERPVLNGKFRGLDWVTYGLGYGNACYDELYHHKFCNAAIGNCADPFRLWECLYVGTIPVLVKSTELSWFKDLPILQVESWDDITKDYLECKYNEIHSKEYPMYKLKMSYWLDIIQEDINEQFKNISAG